MAGKANYLVRAKNGAVFVTSTLAEAKKVEASGAAPAKRRRNPAGSAKSDKAVIKAFTEQKAASGKSLHTDGVQLDGYWMGGNRLAYWSGDKIHLPDTGSVAGQKIQRAVVKETPRFWLADQHYLTGRRNPAGYYTVVIPPARYDQPDTEWHANRTVTRGAFSSKAKATAWAKEHLRGYPYSIKKIDLSRNPSAAEHLQRGAKRYGIAVKLRGKDLDAATRLAFSAESDLEDGGDHSGSEDAHALGLSLLRARRNPAKSKRGVQAAVSRAKQEIAQDQRDGIVPVGVHSFADLHDYVDANTYGGMADPDGPLSHLSGGAFIAAANKVIDQLDKWLKKKHNPSKRGSAKRRRK